MTARTWTASDPEPAGVYAVVDPHGVTWAHETDGWGATWNERLITHLDNGCVTTGSAFNSWRGIFDHLPEGAVLREATEDEARTIVQRWPAKPEERAS